MAGDHLAEVARQSRNGSHGRWFRAVSPPSNPRQFSVIAGSARSSRACCGRPSELKDEGYDPVRLQRQTSGLNVRANLVEVDEVAYCQPQVSGAVALCRPAAEEPAHWEVCRRDSRRGWKVGGRGPAQVMAVVKITSLPSRTRSARSAHAGREPRIGGSTSSCCREGADAAVVSAGCPCHAAPDPAMVRLFRHLP